MDQFIKVNDVIRSVMDMAKCIIKMDLIMKENELMIKLMAKEGLFNQMATIMREIGY